MALTELKIKNVKPEEKQFKLTDGEGMHLLVHPNGSKYWRLQYRFDGKQKMLALGTYPDVSLAKARELRAEYRKYLKEGIDPALIKANGGKPIDKDDIPTEIIKFKDVAVEWHKSNNRWSDHHRQRVLSSLEANIFPSIGDSDIRKLTTRDLWLPIKAVEDSGRIEVAQRMLQRIKSIMRFAVQTGILTYNPSHDLTGAVAPQKVKHRPALPLEKLPELLARIDSYQGKLLTKLAVKLSLLIFIRSSELRFARWEEIDFDKAIWTIPAEREALAGVKYSSRGSKMRTPHLVPLSRQAIEILREIQEISGDKPIIFIGDRDSTKVMSEGTVNKALARMGYDTKTEVCGHGFRTMACSSLIESGKWSRDAVERQMSHQERNGVRAAYIHKAEHINERRLMMQWWADFIDANRNETTAPFDFNVVK